MCVCCLCVVCVLYVCIVLFACVLCVLEAYVHVLVVCAWWWHHHLSPPYCSLEAIYIQCSLIDRIVVYVDVTHDDVIAIVQPNINELRRALSNHMCGFLNIEIIIIEFILIFIYNYWINIIEFIGNYYEFILIPRWNYWINIYLLLYHTQMELLN